MTYKIWDQVSLKLIFLYSVILGGGDWVPKVFEGGGASFREWSRFSQQIGESQRSGYSRESTVNAQKIQSTRESESFDLQLNHFVISRVCFQSGKIAHELDYVNHHVRTKLDELKRNELERLRHAAIKAYELENGLNTDHLKIAEHLDHQNPHSFEIEDLKKLIAKVHLKKYI